MCARARARVCTGSGIDTPSTFAAAATKLVELLPLFPTVRFVDFGGGLSVPYDPSKKAPLDLDAFASAVAGTMADLPFDLQYRSPEGRSGREGADMDTSTFTSETRCDFEHFVLVRSLILNYLSLEFTLTLFLCL